MELQVRTVSYSPIFYIKTNPVLRANSETIFERVLMKQLIDGLVDSFIDGLIESLIDWMGGRLMAWSVHLSILFFGLTIW